MSTPEDQLDRASGGSDADGTDSVGSDSGASESESAGEAASAEASGESGNGAGGRIGLRGRRARRAARTSSDSSDVSGAETSSSTSGDLTQVSSDSSAPAPPKRRRFGRDTGDTGDTGEATVVAPAPAPPVTREPVTYSSGSDYSAGSTEAEAVLLDDSGEIDEPYPSRRAMVSAPVPVYGERRVRQTVSRVDLWSITKLSLCFYISSMFVMIVALISLWLIADAAGIIKSVEDFLGDLLEAKNFTFLSGDVLRGTILVGLVIVALQVVITVIAASFYNIFAELFGGLEITVKEEDDLR